jgi:hypothetical protein
MSNTHEGIRIFTGVLTARFEGDYVPASDIPQYLDEWLTSGLEDRDDLRGWSLETLAVAEAPQPMVNLVWQWIVNANNGLGSDVGDLMEALERAGYGCPEGIGDE